MKKNLLGIPLSAEGIFRLSSKRAMKQGKVTEKGKIKFTIRQLPSQLKTFFYFSKLP
jgi:hypothetical protein